MKEVKAIIRTFKLDAVLNALHQVGNLPIVFTADSHAVDVSSGMFEPVRMAKIEVMVPDDLVEAVVGLIGQAAHTGNLGDGRIFVIPIDDSVVIRTGERGENAR